jgi:hypothetical protein
MAIELPPRLLRDYVAASNLAANRTAASAWLAILSARQGTADRGPESKPAVDVIPASVGAVAAA